MNLINKQTAQLSDFFHRYVTAKEQLKQQFEALHLLTGSLICRRCKSPRETKQLKGKP
jgi:hypothetical protein